MASIKVTLLTGAPGSHGAPEQVWARVGFEHFRDGVHVLDLSLVTP